MRLYIFFFFALINSLSVLSQKDTTAHFKNQFLIKIQPTTPLAKIKTSIESKINSDCEIELISSHNNIYLCKLVNTTQDEYTNLQLLNSIDGIEIAQFNHLPSLRAVPNDALFAQQWALDNIGQGGGTVDADIDAPEAWNITTSGVTANGDSIVIAIVDDGVQLNHPDLNLWKNYNEIAANGIDDDGNGYIDDVNGWNAVSGANNIVNNNHGTHVTGIACAKGNNTIGISGLCWNTKSMIVVGSTTSEATAIAAYDYVLQNRILYNTSGGTKGAFVVATNSSFGVNNGQQSNYPLWCGMYDTLGRYGILSIGATANVNSDIDAVGDIPTSCNSNFLITVTNSTKTDTKYSAAGYGATTIDLAAPGTTIYSTVPTSTYAQSGWIGTSMASPHVAATVALMWAAACSNLVNDYKLYPDSFALIFKDYILNSVDALPSLNNLCATSGRLNTNNALLAVQQYCGIGIEEYKVVNQNNFIQNIFPNPSSNYIEISYYSNEENYFINIYNALGEKVKTISRSNHKGFSQHTTNIGDLESGIYFVEISTRIGISNKVKFLKLE